MSDIQATPIPAESSGPAVMSVEQILDLERKLRENKAAQLRSEPEPHQITSQQLRDAVAAIRRQRGTLDLAGRKGKKAAGASSIELLDLDGI